MNFNRVLEAAYLRARDEADGAAVACCLTKRAGKHEDSQREYEAFCHYEDLRKRILVWISES